MLICGIGRKKNMAALGDEKTPDLHYLGRGLLHTVGRFLWMIEV